MKQTKTLIGRLDNATTDPAPLLTYFPPAEEVKTDIALIVFPGGGYKNLSEHEGEGYAEYFSSHGIHCFVVKYRLGSDGHRHPAMLEDALAAIQTVRRESRGFGVNPRKIGVVGSSAGGHIAAHAMVDFKLRDGGVSPRPDFGILCYPVISAKADFRHQGSFDSLIGEAPTPGQTEEVSLETRVTGDTPPCFIWHTAEDTAVPAENSMVFAQALRANNVPFELHLYDRGRHGLGLGTEHDWEADAVKWLEKILV